MLYVCLHLHLLWILEVKFSVTSCLQKSRLVNTELNWNKINFKKSCQDVKDFFIYDEFAGVTNCFTETENDWKSDQMYWKLKTFFSLLTRVVFAGSSQCVGTSSHEAVVLLVKCVVVRITRHHTVLRALDRGTTQPS